MTKSIELQWCIVVVIVSVWRLFSVVMGIVSIPLIFIRFCLIGFFWFWIDGKSRDTERRRGRGRTLWSIIIRKKFLFRNEKINNDHTQKKMCWNNTKKKMKEREGRKKCWPVMIQISPAMTSPITWPPWGDSCHDSNISSIFSIFFFLTFFLVFLALCFLAVFSTNHCRDS